MSLPVCWSYLQMSNLQAQLGQIESTAIMKSQELEEAVELFNSKVCMHECMYMCV